MRREGANILNIIKVLNNNAAVLQTAEQTEIIAMGNGIAFGKKAGDMIAKAAIEKTFSLVEQETSHKFKALVQELPMAHILLSEDIIQQARALLGVPLNAAIFITLTDHISYALHRYETGVKLKNTFLWDIKQFYPKEFEAGLLALDIVKTATGVSFLEDEAGFIALHFVNATQYQDTDLKRATQTTELIAHISEAVRKHFDIVYDTEQLSHYRFINHIRFLAQRIINNVMYADDGDTTLDFLMTQHADAYACVCQIANEIKQTHGHQMTKEEQLYMSVHIARLVKDSSK